MKHEPYGLPIGAVGAVDAEHRLDLRRQRPTELQRLARRPDADLHTALNPTAGRFPARISQCY